MNVTHKVTLNPVYTYVYHIEAGPRVSLIFRKREKYRNVTVCIIILITYILTEIHRRKDRVPHGKQNKVKPTILKSRTTDRTRCLNPTIKNIGRQNDDVLC